MVAQLGLADDAASWGQNTTVQCERGMLGQEIRIMYECRRVRRNRGSKASCMKCDSSKRAAPRIESLVKEA